MIKKLIKLIKEDMNEVKDAFIVDKIVLEKIKFGLKRYMSPVLLSEIEIESWKDHFIDSIVYGIKSFVYGNKVREEVMETIKYPSNWLEALKERWLPSFLKRRFPVRYKAVDKIIRHYHICPHINYKTPTEERLHLTFLKGETND